MQQVPWMDLIPQRRYRIEHAKGILPTMLGTFISIYPNLRGNRVVSASFDTIINSKKKLHTKGQISLRTDEWVFFEAADSVVASQVARGLSNTISENAAGIVKRMLVGNTPSGRGPNRFPARTRKNRKSRKSRP